MGISASLFLCSDAQIRDFSEELMFYFDRLRNVDVAASRKGHGLLFSRYEDW